MEQEQRRTIVLNSTVINVTQRPINLSGTKIYDGNTTLNNSIVSVSSGLIGIETLTLTGEVNTNNANVGSYSASGGTLNVGSTTINIANGSNGGLAANYAINDGNFTITQRPVGVSGTRLYDATTNAVASDLSTHANLVGSETLTLSGTGTIASKDVGSNKTVSVGTLALADGSNGGLAANYTLSGGTHQLTVNQRPLNATLARQYDGTTAAAGSTLSSFDALQGGETLTMTGSGTAASANVANGIAMSSNGNLALADGTGAASNYSLNSTVINVTQRPISVSGTRLYDATTNAVASDLSTHANLVGSQTLTLSGTGTIANKDVGNNKTVSVGTLALGNGSNGGLAGNYTLSGGTHQLTVNQRPLNATLARQYDGTTAAAGST